jgi:hypothetical protein
MWTSPSAPSDCSFYRAERRDELSSTQAHAAQQGLVLRCAIILP